MENHDSWLTIPGVCHIYGALNQRSRINDVKNVDNVRNEEINLDSWLTIGDCDILHVKVREIPK